MHPSEISTSADIVLDHTFGDQIFDQLVPVPGEWDFAVIFCEKGLDFGIVLENPPRGHHERPLLRFVCVNAPGEVDPSKFEGSFTKPRLFPNPFLSGLLRFNHFLQPGKHVRVPIYGNVSSDVYEGTSDVTFISEFCTFRDHTVPFRIPNGEIVSVVSGFNKLGVNTNMVVSRGRAN